MINDILGACFTNEELHSPPRLRDVSCAQLGTTTAGCIWIRIHQTLLSLRICLRVTRELSPKQISDLQQKLLLESLMNTPFSRQYLKKCPTLILRTRW